MRRFLLCLPLLAACTSPPDPDTLVTIDQGVYGLTVSGCDTGDCSDQPYEHAPVTATPVAGGTAFSTTSDGDGFFELALPAGDYQLCVHSCTTITIIDATRIRRDFVSGPGGGVWCIDDVCHAPE